MAEIWGAIEGFFGLLLNAFYQGIHPLFGSASYGIAIILLTLVTRLVIAPLGVKQIRSMQKMQTLQPKIKELQKKYKGDRQKLNEEMMKLYKEHGANPLGGCVPMIAQFPVFIALYAVIRSAVPLAALPAPDTKIPAAITKSTFCRPVVTSPTDSAVKELPTLNGEDHPNAVRCDLPKGKTETVDIQEWQDAHTHAIVDQPPSYLAHCTPKGNVFNCASPLGTGHVPKDGKLFKALVEDKESFLGMHLACSPTQASSSTQTKFCTAHSSGKASGAAQIAYYALVLLMAGTTYLQQRQMSARAPAGQQQQQMKMMATMMPVLFGFLSLNFPAALSVYWVTGNVWTIAQQKVIFGKQEPVKPEPPQKKGKKKS
ncbi:MAG: YidC/Oxa1 family membrane protein insertase [Actinomycetota bacterium]|nr:YidC/Oxa1 family membrane protein insertase [Actinomycetota bacterium]